MARLLGIVCIVLVIMLVNSHRHRQIRRARLQYKLEVLMWHIENQPELYENGLPQTLRVALARWFDQLWSSVDPPIKLVEDYEKWKADPHRDPR